MRRKRKGSPLHSSSFSARKKIAALKKRLESGRGIAKVTGKQLAALFQARKQEIKDRASKARAVAARAAYKPRKKDFGKIVLISTQGKADPQKKGRSGYPVYVTKTGKVQLLAVPQGKQPYRPRKLREIELPLRKNLRHKVTEFQRKRAKTLATGSVRRAEIEQKVIKQVRKTGLKGDAATRLEDFKLTGNAKGRASVTTGGKWDFNDAAVTKIAKHIQKVIKAQRGQRNFIIRVMGLIELPDKSRQVVEFFVDISRRDSDAVRLGGVENFVKQKFYAYMARELAFLGYVTSGSNNHIRRLSDNQGRNRSDWKDSRGANWVGQDLEVCNLISLEWIIQQA